MKKQTDAARRAWLEEQAKPTVVSMADCGKRGVLVITFVYDPFYPLAEAIDRQMDQEE